MTNRLTAEDVQAVVNGYRAGKTARELAERFSISDSSVTRLLRGRDAGSAARASVVSWPNP
jgi:transposase